MKEQPTTINELKDNEHVDNDVSENRPEYRWQINIDDLLFDLKFILKEYYIASFVESCDSLKISFKNGQSFILSVKAA